MFIKKKKETLKKKYQQHQPCKILTVQKQNFTHSEREAGGT